MPRKSDKSRERRISATEASRSFSRLLDAVAAGRRFLIHRRGQDVCVMTPPGSPGDPPAAPGRTALECLELLRQRSQVRLDGEFAKDLLDVLRGEGVETRTAWDS